MKIKTRKAGERDIPSILEIISHYSRKGLILERTEDEILSSLDNFIVAEENGYIIGVISFYNYGERLKEVRSLGVIEKHSRKGVGSVLLKALIEKISQSCESKIFVLTYSPEFFDKNGFDEVERESLPEKIWKDCSNCANKDNCKEIAMVYRG
ncbi:MAG: N-acetyltransferase [Spirochaetes bacterium]|jgi:amino-acid N-acetyltransferase|nr:N-acetyltransferase [Spirochaetota bacterium]